MLPSTGYFKGIYCPFYYDGVCERPYCHFRHFKKESINTPSEGIESGTILQKLVSAAVQRVLQQTESTTPIVSSQSENNLINSVPNIGKVTYNPTPISELNKINNLELENNVEGGEQRKRHIPVPYTPRKPASLPIQRPDDANNATKSFIYSPPSVNYTPGSAVNVPSDKYTPTGTIVSKEKYLPGIEIELQEYHPIEGSKSSSSKINYVPSDKSVCKKKILEYKPTKVTNKRETPTVSYQPTPRELAPCFSSDDEEPITKKRKISPDLNGLDDLGAEFDILDQILHEEKYHQDKISKNPFDNVNSKSDINKKENEINEDKGDQLLDNSDKAVGVRGKLSSKKEKNIADTNHNGSSKSHRKSSSSKKKKSAKDKDKSKYLKKNSDVKSKHNSSSKDKYKECRDKREQCSNDKSKGSSSESSSKHSKVSSSKKHELKKPSSRHKSKTKDKNEYKRSHKSSNDPKSKYKHKENIVNDCADNDGLNDDQLIDVELDDLESDEDAIALECRKIFDEYIPVEKPKIIEEIAKPEESTEEDCTPGKKRISRAVDSNIKVVVKGPIKPDFKMSAAQQMADRLTKIREYHNVKNNTVPSNSESTLTKSIFTQPVVSSTKIRIAHVPYASTLMNAKKTISPIHNIKKNEPSTSTTITQTVKKGTQRVAHIPSEKYIDRPGVLEPLGSKIPANIRSTYLNMIIDECLKLYLTATDAYARAQHEELNTSKKCSTVQIYKNSAVLTVSRLRKEVLECKGIKKSASDCSMLQKVPGVSPTTTGSWSILCNTRKNVDNSIEFRGPKLYGNIKKWILTDEQLQDNGFPRPHESGQKGKAIIYGQNKKPAPKGFTRNCCRCKQDYIVDKKGFAVVKAECIYHPNNKYKIRGEVRYQCCSQDGSSDGCCIAPSHVYEYVDYDNLTGFVKTLPPETIRDDYGIYSLDCEMCYTTHGLDLTRITVINSDCKVVYESLIKPLHPIIDYNTRYSGITEEQMVDVKTTLLDVQATLLTMFNSKTILIGHSLESDFKVLKLIHDTVIDTSVLFPHKMGPPYKRALRNLSSEYLKKIIQNSVDGHDSAEDATVCMELIRYKLKEDLKTR